MLKEVETVIIAQLDLKAEVIVQDEHLIGML